MAWRPEYAERRKEYDRRYYANLTSERRSEVVALKTERRRLISQKLAEYKSELKCACGESHPAALDFHHADDNKEVTVASAISRGWRWERVLQEIQKCVVLCANCHRKLHFNQKFGV